MRGGCFVVCPLQLSTANAAPLPTAPLPASRSTHLTRPPPHPHSRTHPQLTGRGGRGRGDDCKTRKAGIKSEGKQAQHFHSTASLCPGKQANGMMGAGPGRMCATGTGSELCCQTVSGGGGIVVGAKVGVAVEPKGSQEGCCGPSTRPLPHTPTQPDPPPPPPSTTARAPRAAPSALSKQCPHPATRPSYKHPRPASPPGPGPSNFGPQ